MTNKLELYRCNICQNIVEVMHQGVGELVCCGQPMEKINPKTEENEGILDKHVPVIEKTIEGFKIRIGAQRHPMNEEHHIYFIQAISNDQKYVKTKYLDINEEPELDLKCNHNSLWARALCNIHGLFKGDFNA